MTVRRGFRGTEKTGLADWLTHCFARSLGDRCSAVVSHSRLPPPFLPHLSAKLIIRESDGPRVPRHCERIPWRLKTCPTRLCPATARTNRAYQHERVGQWLSSDLRDDSVTIGWIASTFVRSHINRVRFPHVYNSIWLVCSLRSSFLRLSSFLLCRAIILVPWTFIFAQRKIECILWKF